jgi:hypothetical protein
MYKLLQVICCYFVVTQSTKERRRKIQTMLIIILGQWSFSTHASTNILINSPDFASFFFSLSIHSQTEEKK